VSENRTARFVASFDKDREAQRQRTKTGFQREKNPSIESRARARSNREEEKEEEEEENKEKTEIRSLSHRIFLTSCARERNDQSRAKTAPYLARNQRG
jgi:hypothetical protein